MRKFAFVIVLSIAFSSCATIFGTTSTSLGVDTDPQGAHVKIFNRNEKLVYEGQSPATVPLPSANGYFKKGIYRIELSMDGYEKKQITVSSHINGWYFGNILIGGALGFLVIDPLTGAMYKLDEKLVNEKLAPKAVGVSMTTGASTLKLLSLRDVPAEWRGRLERLP
jgi:hypothetical protein